MERDDPAWTLTRLALKAQHDPDPEIRAMGAHLTEWWWSGATDPLDRVLGFASAPGRRSPRTQKAIERRDELIRGAAQMFFPNDRPTAQARQLADALSRYSTSAWRYERTKDACPAHYEGKLRAHLWAILKARDYAISARQIRDLLP